MTRVLSQKFFERKALVVAQELLGKFIVRKIEGRKVAMMITETEAYVGPHDKASHAARGRTARTEVMFGPPGHWYVYFVYGMHWMLNIVTDRKGHPAAVLIRGGVLENGKVQSGPARLTRELQIDGKQNVLRAAKGTSLWIEDRGVEFSRSDICKTPRIGVSYAGVWAHKPYRFVLKDKVLQHVNLRVE